PPHNSHPTVPSSSALLPGSDHARMISSATLPAAPRAQVPCVAILSRHRDQQSFSALQISRHIRSNSRSGRSKTFSASCPKETPHLDLRCDPQGECCSFLPAVSLTPPSPRNRATTWGPARTPAHPLLFPAACRTSQQKYSPL